MTVHLITALGLAAACAAVGSPVRASEAPGASGDGRPPPSTDWQIVDPGQGPVELPKRDTPARELSGITWAGGRRYFVVSDKLGTVFPMEIALDPERGMIVRADIEPGVQLAGSRDLEGVAYDREHDSLLVSDEVGPAIREYRVRDGELLRTIPLPAIYRTARHNLSLESLAADAGGAVLWTANEEALDADGPLAESEVGSVVRLQRFANGRPAGQWAYVADPLVGNLLGPGRDIESSGVSDLALVPGGGVLALERAYGAGGLRTRLYGIDFTGASDVSAAPALRGAQYRAVRKRLLWERMFPDLNYEGVAVGPLLAGGGISLILLSDDGHRQRQTLYPLVLQPPAGNAG